MAVETTIVWFRQDLRVIDNPALFWAVEQGKILPLYIIEENQDDQEQIGAASKWWLHHSLHLLNKRLNDHLIVRVGSPESIIVELLDETDATQITWNRCYEPSKRIHDAELKRRLKDKGYNVKSFNGSLLWEPMGIAKNDGTPYKVFTPYYRNGCLKSDSPRYPLPAPTRMTYANNKFRSASIDSLQLLPKIKWDASFYDVWTPGEEGAAEKLSEFIQNAASGYKDQRNIPSVSGTSKLSPHLHFGEISPNQAWYAVLDAFDGSENDNIDTFLSELGWREFSYYLLYHWPEIVDSNFNSKFNDFPWKDSIEHLQAWQKGVTGIPIVDAGMRELWNTGYMHNRIRMVVGSFLVKNLLIDWRHGAKWFWDCLVDADLASNSASWQWVAGSGADAAPYFRIFNPVLQGEKFDKDGTYVKQYCPELAELPNKYIHKPWEAPSEVLKAANVDLGQTYPKPIVDLKASRQRALSAYDRIKG